MTRRTLRSWTFLVAALPFFGCGGPSGAGADDLGTGGPADLTMARPDGGMDLAPPAVFPATPLLDTAAGAMPPSNAAALFGGAGGGLLTGGPCLIEPQIGALFPSNWLRLRVRFVAPQGQNLFEIRLHADSQENDLVVYTASTTWTMSAEMWRGLAAHSADQPLTVQVRGAVFDGTKLVGQPALGSSGTIRIAPVPASGSVVYWTTSGNSALKGFAIGDETVETVLVPSQVEMKTIGGQAVTCIGCHTSTPDGESVGFTAQSPWANALASVLTGSAGKTPAWLGAGARTALGAQNLGIQTFSRAHFKAGDRVEIAPFGKGAAAQLAWFDLEAKTPEMGTAYGILARTGDTRGAGAPAWSHDGSTVVYVSTNAEVTGRLAAGAADLYAMPYGNRAGGAATPVAGASQVTLDEYYPAFSSDDALLAFDRIPTGLDMYNQPQAELYVIPGGGGTPTRLAANDPPACSGVKSPGVTNSWPKWSPEVLASGSRSYYWLIFSSTRGTKFPQLYMAAVVMDRNENAEPIQTYPAVYLWNQPAGESNHTPAWDAFQIPVQ